ncbi:MAG: DUF2933 domain-containing protein [Patescibacteria group bacterium]
MNNQTKIILIISLAVISFYLFFEHRAHIFGNSQYLLLGLFIFMHVFMHKGHGDHGGPSIKGKRGHHG